MSELLLNNYYSDNNTYLNNDKNTYWKEGGQQGNTEKFQWEDMVKAYKKY
jgi:hypothetical protein